MQDPVNFESLISHDGCLPSTQYQVPRYQGSPSPTPNPGYKYYLPKSLSI